MSLHDEEDSTQFEHDPTRPHPTDFSLDLERQLETESIPSSPADDRAFSQPDSLDSQVLASIVTQLRLSLSDVTRERDDLANLLAEVQTRETGVKDALHQVSEKAIVLEGELSAALEKQKEDQDAIVMLRGKLEDSRRALMRLQTESRRMSQASNMTIDLSRAGPSTLSGPPSSRRSSFVPVTGSASGRINAHRRISSVSDSSTYYQEHGQLSSSPRPSQLEPLHLLSSSAPAIANPPVNNRRISGFFGRATPELPPTADASEIEELRKELQAVKEQLEETRHELTEAKEGQEASETCANALRTFIAENSIGMHPPGKILHAASQSTSGTSSGEGSNRNSIGSSRWAFRLWNTPSNAASPSSSPALPPVTAPSSSAPPLSRKLGGFFSSRASMSSTSSAPPVSHSEQDPICNGFDSSSDDSGTEPVSPASELPGTNILVQSLDRSPVVLTDSPEQKKGELLAVDLDHDRLVTVS